jgi:hypothetical protein
MLATVKGSDFSHAIKEAADDLVRFGKHHDISDVKIAEVAGDLGDGAGRAADAWVKDKVHDAGDAIVDRAATWVDEQQKQLQSHRVSVTPCGAR